MHADRSCDTQHANISASTTLSATKPHQGSDVTVGDLCNVCGPARPRRLFRNAPISYKRWLLQNEVLSVNPNMWTTVDYVIMRSIMNNNNENIYSWRNVYSGGCRCWITLKVMLRTCYVLSTFSSNCHRNCVYTYSRVRRRETERRLGRLNWGSMTYGTECTDTLNNDKQIYNNIQSIVMSVHTKVSVDHM